MPQLMKDIATEVGTERITRSVPWTYIRPILSIGALVLSTATYGQTTGGDNSNAAAAPLAEVSAYLKTIGLALTGIGTLLGLPLVLQRYKRTRSEITKLDLESEALRRKLASASAVEEKGSGGAIRILVDRSPNSTVQVLADPRFLGPLLLLLDFIIAWILLTLASYFLGIFDIRILREIGLGVLAAVLLIPIAKQAIHVRNNLRPLKTEQEAAAADRQARILTYTVYLIVAFIPLGFGAFVIAVALSGEEINAIGWIMAWSSLGFGVLLLVVGFIIKGRVDRYIGRMCAVFSADRV